MFTVFALVALYIWKGGNVATYIIIFLLLCIFFSSKKYTSKILLDESNIKIYYYRWGVIHTLTFSNKEIQVKPDYYAGRNGYKYKTLNIILNSKIAYIITESDGFDESDLDKISKAFENKNTQV